MNGWDRTDKINLDSLALPAPADKQKAPLKV
jgi:hypothetical protein